MKLKDIYQKAIETGMHNDPRSMDVVMKDIEQKKKSYDELKPDEKDFFDMESLQNPYADSRILFGTGDEEIRTALAGIDIEVGEVLLAESLRSKGKQVDLLLSHHPEGRAYANLYDVMRMQWPRFRSHLGLEGAARVSLTNHDHGGLEELDFAPASRRPQKMRGDGTGGAN